MIVLGHHQRQDGEHPAEQRKGRDRVQPEEVIGGARASSSVRVHAVINLADWGESLHTLARHSLTREGQKSDRRYGKNLAQFNFSIGQVLFRMVK